MKIGGSMMLMLAALTAHAADTASEARWAWTCGTKVFYAMHITPDGKAQPIVEQNAVTLNVELKRQPEKWAFADICPDKHDYFEIHDSGDLFSTRDSIACHQIVNFRYRRSGSIDQRPE